MLNAISTTTNFIQNKISFVPEVGIDDTFTQKSAVVEAVYDCIQ